MTKEEGKSPEFLKIDKEHDRQVAMISAKPKLKRLGIGLWMLIDGALIVFVLLYLVSYVFGGFFSERRQVAKVGNNIESTRAISVARSAVPLAPDSVRVIQSDTGKYDFYVILENPNMDWRAEFDYFFSSSAGDSSRFSGFVLPGQEKLMVAFSEEFERRPNDSDLVLENIVWSRVDGHEINDVSAWLDEHNNFIIEDAVFSTELELEDSNIARSSFTIENMTPYSYWFPEFIVTLERNNTIQALNTITIAGLESGEKREIDINWFGIVPSSGTVRVTPNINYFDKDVYMAPPGELVDESHEL